MEISQSVSGKYASVFELKFWDENWSKKSAITHFWARAEQR
jgi:hypothetical protein